MADPGVLHGVTPGRLRRELEGRRFTAPRRHGRWLIAPTDGPVHEDQRKLRGLWLATTEAAVDRVLGRRGPDALTLDRAGLDARLADRRGRAPKAPRAAAGSRGRTSAWCPHCRPDGG
ncbi:hypothetical protein [Streptomyces cucumeris]|uniref:hypothetical protein n=1 Tax=Streptomyces cucumeris TaxID=2962890 RepID=UPI003D74E0D6